jgi:HEAT repeat protein
MKTFSAITLIGLVSVWTAVAVADVTKEDLPRILKDLKHGNAKARAQAATDAGNLGAIRASDAKDTVPLLLQAAKKDADTEVRRAATEALGKVGAEPKSTVPVLRERLEKDKAMAVRVAAARALGQIGPEAQEAMPALREAAKEPKEKKNRPLTQAAREAMKRIRAK